MSEDKDLKPLEIKLKKEEVEAIRLVDIQKIKIKNAAKKMKLSIVEFNVILQSGRGKVAKYIDEGNTIKILIEEEEYVDDTLYFTFRCATCGTIYRVTGYEERVQCPLCFSNKVMSAEEAGFYKKSYWN
ncbi:MAG: DUF134 domain-containing protein [Peptostreptococcaceae bacterium]